MTWHTLTPTQVEALPDRTTVRVTQGDTTIQGPITGLEGHDQPDIWVGGLRVKDADRVQVRESDVPGGAG